VGQLVTLWLSTLALLVLFALAFAGTSDEPGRYVEALKAVAVFAALPALVGAGVFNWLVRHAVA
jgi:hypothetical protein